MTGRHRANGRPRPPRTTMCPPTPPGLPPVGRLSLAAGMALVATVAVFGSVVPAELPPVSSEERAVGPAPHPLFAALPPAAPPAAPLPAFPGPVFDLPRGVEIGPVLRAAEARPLLAESARRSRPGAQRDEPVERSERVERPERDEQPKPRSRPKPRPPEPEPDSNGDGDGDEVSETDRDRAREWVQRWRDRNKDSGGDRGGDSPTDRPEKGDTSNDNTNDDDKDGAGDADDD